MVDRLARMWVERWVDGKAERSVGLKVATLVAERAAPMGVNLAAP